MKNALHTGAAALLCAVAGHITLGAPAHAGSWQPGQYMDCAVGTVPTSGYLEGYSIVYSWSPIELAAGEQPLQLAVVINGGHAASATLQPDGPLAWAGATDQTGTPVRVTADPESLTVRVQHGPFDVTGHCTVYDPRSRDTDDVAP